MVRVWAERVAVRNGGERVCRECPILLIARCLGDLSWPVGENASEIPRSLAGCEVG